MAARTPSLRTALQRAQQPVSRLAPASFARRQSGSQHTVPLSEQNKDRRDLVVESNEYVKTGHDSSASETQETAFGKQQTGVNEQFTQSEDESKKIGQTVNPLDVSPANSKVSEASHDRGGKVTNVRNNVPSGGGVSKKNAAGKKYEKESEIKGQASNKGRE
ncbi:hypothetical protein LTR37_004765 [Vermiconidia calcicola]|uniref:Uncharacterized protein n=1 Tax=Vermiconidia calcicola TaxID=1690605 RepID=A0ACC3NL91_9PEZI|nr:hypothetical protein LTR37_004765 [Vermiconidia calcicola]